MIERIFGDMSEEFEFDEETMDYVDGPLSGWLRNKRTGMWFAYDCQPIIAGMLWHWTVIPVEEKTDVTKVLVQAVEKKTGSWVSIIEDRRIGGESTCRLVTIESSAAAPVLSSVRSRRL